MYAANFCTCALCRLRRALGRLFGCRAAWQREDHARHDAAQAQRLAEAEENFRMAEVVLGRPIPRREATGQPAGGGRP